MGYYGFLGMNNNVGFGSNSPYLSGPQATRVNPGAPMAATPENSAASEGGTTKKNGFSGFIQGLKNGLVNTVKGLFSFQGLLITAGTIGLVAATGGAALLPLAALGVGMGGYKITKGVIQGDTEQIGEGTFTLGASLLGAKVAPKTIGTETLADTSLIGKLKAPFMKKGAFTNPDANFYSVGKDAATKTFNGTKGALFGSQQTHTIEVTEAGNNAGIFSRIIRSPITLFNKLTGRAAAGNGATTTEYEIIQEKPSVFSGIYQRAKSGQTWAETKKWFSGAAPNPSNSGSNTQSPHTGTQVSFSQRAQNYLKTIKNSPHTASTYMGAVLSGNTEKSAAKEEGQAAGGETLYY